MIVFFGFVLLVENALIGLWAWVVHGASAGEGWTYSGWGVYSIAMLCSAAASFIGGLVGFLFGVPRLSAAGEQTRIHAEEVRTDSRSTNQPAPDQQPQPAEQATRIDADSQQQREPAPGLRLRPSTNVESVSDALTKGLLAIGATNLLNIGRWATRLADVLGPSLGPGNDGRVVAVSVVTYGAIAGLLFGYLATRIYLTPVFEQNDPSSVS